jgi:hypothetical protein
MYTKDSEAKITYFEKSIAEFKANIQNEIDEDKAIYQENLTVIEQKSIELKKNLFDLKDDGQDKWISFRDEFNKDMEGLATAFKNLTTKNNQNESNKN